HEDLAEHTESETEIGVLDEPANNQGKVPADDIAPSDTVIARLGRLVNVAPSVLIGVQYSDLAATYLDFGSEDLNVQAEVAALIEGRKPFPELYDYDTMDLDWATLRLMACNASLIPAVLNSKGEPLDVGRAQRAFPSSIRRAVVLRDVCCAYPGCNMPH